ncbi:hypothetical protein PIB30_046369 [Stylosanthes scabra]|uniref:Zinc finger GRF-type domain-containing protein n=1 Tax=Stylosanthes scabra TaxID=79078 RepID=A0ABU6ZF99_9FABA|nr:hypothetical protein [Stylosanthes scabra]
MCAEVSINGDEVAVTVPRWREHSRYGYKKRNEFAANPSIQLVHQRCQIRVLTSTKGIGNLQQNSGMESEGVSSGSARSASGGRSRRSSLTQGVYAAKVGDDKDGANPKCMCGVYAVLYMSKTANNPNRLFFGCPFFKKNGPGKLAKEEQDVTEHFARFAVDNRVAELENRVAKLEEKRHMNPMFFLGLLVGFFAICVIVLRR